MRAKTETFSKNLAVKEEKKVECIDTQPSTHLLTAAA